MPHFHLSAQSGDDLILKRMKRRHTRADTIAFCDTVRRAAARCRLRRRSDRGLSHRNRRDVREQSQAGGRCGPAHAACLSLSARARARRPRACRNCRAIWSRNAPRVCARKARRRWARRLDAMRGTRQIVLVEKAGIGPHALFRAGMLRRPVTPRHAGHGCASPAAPAAI